MDSPERSSAIGTQGSSHILEKHSPSAWNSAELVHHCTHSDRQTLRVKKPMGRTIPKASNWGSTQRLVGLASYSHSSAQQLEKQHNWPITQSNSLGNKPTLHPSEHHKTNNEAVEKRIERMKEAWEQATRAINRKATTTPLAQYNSRDQVWLEATHLKLPHQGSKLNPKWYGPFKVLNAVSPVAFKLDHPVSWTIHPIFHASLLTPYVETYAHSPNYS